MAADALVDIGSETIVASAQQVLSASAVVTQSGPTVAAAALQVIAADATITQGGSAVIATALQVINASAAGIDIGGELVFAAAQVLPPNPVLYSSVDDAINAIGASQLLQLSDLDNRGVIDNARVIAAIQCADGIIDSYIGKRYAVPLEVVPTSIATVSCNWALRFLRLRAYKVQPLAEDIKAEEIDREWLAGIAAGTISLGVEPRPAKASDRIDVGQARREGTRHMTLRRMRGFI